jgi:hypothetical protein
MPVRFGRCVSYSEAPTSRTRGVQCPNRSARGYLKRNRKAPEALRFNITVSRRDGCVRFSWSRMRRARPLCIGDCSTRASPSHHYPRANCAVVYYAAVGCEGANSSTELGSPWHGMPAVFFEKPLVRGGASVTRPPPSSSQRVVYWTEV